ncbi:MAG: hypothetical protein JW892_11880 [Anaerolineae bacterium]|nr:hypothetical protein [Anaerolineae bacterium]
MTLRHQRGGIATLALVAMLTTIWLIHLPSQERQVGFTCNPQSCHQTAVPQENPGTPFMKGAIDLTGDGEPEMIQLEGHEIRVLQNGAEIWHSDPEWQVVDVALGDPNDNGRYEILAALWKPNDAGERLNHPYIIAHRGGTMKLIWGGSAVTHPIHELLLADVDGDGVQELCVLESAQPGDSSNTSQRTLSVWDWHGWGFSLRWRSEPGHYHNLGVTEENTIVITSRE